MEGEAGRTFRRKKQVRDVYRQFRESRGAQIDLAFLLQDWEDPYNVGGMFRVADACGATQMVLAGRTPTPPHPQIHVTSLGQHRRVPWRYEERWEDAARRIKGDGYSLVAVEIAEGATPYDECDYPSRICLVLGNEAHGIYTSLMRLRDAAVYVPMWGKGRSLNVHVAAAVVAFHIRSVGSSVSSRA
jgi:tRNA (guanosine-2'-O-)-methyltransferase